MVQIRYDLNQDSAVQHVELAGFIHEVRQEILQLEDQISKKK